MATRLPSGSYRTQIYIGTENGKRVYKSFVADTADAADLAALQYKAAHKEDFSARSFSKSADAFMSAVSQTLSPSTIRGYGSMLRELKKNQKKFCNIALSAIDRQSVQTVLNDISASHTPKTVRNYHAFISSVLKHNGITPPVCTLPKKQKPEYNIPDEAALKQLFEVVKDTELEIPTLLGALVPMRLGEIMGADISDLDGNILHIHHSLARGEHGAVILKSPKTEASDRYVELPAYVADKIRAKGYVCNISIKSFSDRFSDALKRAGIRHFRFHDLRHAFVSIAHAAGIPDAWIMSRGGWSTSYTMTNVYRHTLDSDRKKIESNINETFSKLI